jgi:hypothetical protein
LLDEPGCVLILFRVEQLMRVRIAGQKTLQTNHVRTGFRANQDRAAEAFCVREDKFGSGAAISPPAASRR